MTTADMIHQLRLELWNLIYTQWKTETLFSIQWWSMVALIVIFWSYNIRLLPFYPNPFLHDFTVTPLALMAVLLTNMGTSFMGSHRYLCRF